MYVLSKGVFPPVLRNSGGKPGEPDTATSSAGTTGALSIGETTKSQIYTDPVLPRLSHTLRLHTATTCSSLCVRLIQSHSRCLTCSKLSVCFILNRCNNHKVLIALKLLSAHEPCLAMCHVSLQEQSVRQQAQNCKLHRNDLQQSGKSL